MRKYLLSVMFFGILALPVVPARAQVGNTTGLVVSTCASPTFNTGNPGPFTVDTHGNLCISGSGGGGGAVTQGTSPWIVGVTQWGTAVLGAATTWGTPPTGNVAGMNSNVLASVLPTGAATSALQTTGNTTLTTINTTLGSPFQAGGALAANQSVNLAQVGGTNTVNGGVAGSQSIGGTVATNVAITANPLNLGAQGVSAENAAITTARQVQLVADLVGKLIVLPYANPENFVSGTTAAMTGTTSTSLLGAPAGSLRNYITQISCVNSHATVGTFVTVQDGSGGTALATLAADSNFGGQTTTFPVPLRQPSVATALFVADVTTGANVICSATGYKGL